MRISALIATLMLSLPLALGAGCAEDASVQLDFDRAGVDLSRHPFPTDRYRGATGLDEFSELQLAALPFLGQLRSSGQTGYGPQTAIHLPFTEARSDPDRWIDVDTVSDAVRIYNIDAVATPVAIGEISHDDHTNTVTVRPDAPFVPGRYAVVIERGVIKTRGGDAVGVSPAYDRLIDDGDPLTDAGFALVSGADAGVSSRSDTLAYVEWTVTDHSQQMVLLRSYVNGKLPVDRASADEVIDLTPFWPAADREIAVGDARVLAAGAGPVASYFAAAGARGLPTDAIGRIVTGAFSTPNLLSDTVFDSAAIFTNQTILSRSQTAPFSSDNPASLSQQTPFKVVPYLAFFPKVVSASPPPVIVALHGISRMKEDWLGLANAANAAGFVLVAIDFYQHGARQEDIAHPEGDFSYNLDPALDAAGVAFFDPYVNPSLLARTRDKLRQTVVDQLALVRLVAAADGSRAAIDLDGDGVADDFGDVHLVGVSLGGMLGAIVCAVSPDIHRAVLATPGGTAVQVITDSPALSATIDILVYGAANAPGIGLLGAQDRVLLPDNPERELFTRVAETVTAAADPLTYAAAVLDGSLGGAQPNVLVQLALGDDVVPNDANRRFVRAMAAGMVNPDDLQHVGPFLFRLGIKEVPPKANDPLPAHAVTQFAGSHTFIFDWADPSVTAAAQAQALGFLLQP